MYRRNFIKTSGLAITSMGLSGLTMPSEIDKSLSDKKQERQLPNDSLKEKLLLDTDIGSDIDDSVCLAYLLCQKQCEILGITTVSGDAVNRAKLASVLLKAAGNDSIPIYPGIEQPLLNPQKQPVAHQVKYLSNWPHETKFPEGQAIEFMRRTIRENPNEITLLAVGPLTNISLLFAVDPEIPALLKRLVIMCGVFTYNYQGNPCLSEWNARCDPHATAMVYNAPVKNIVSVGLDVTGQVVMEKDEIIKRFNTSLLKVVLEFSGILDNTRQSIVFHDPLAAAVIFNREICDFKKGNVEVETGNIRLEGLTYWKEDQTGKNDVALGVNKEMFLNHFFDTVTK